MANGSQMKLSAPLQLRRGARDFASAAIAFAVSASLFAAILPYFGYFQFGGTGADWMFHFSLLCEVSAGALLVLLLTATLGPRGSWRAALTIGALLPLLSYFALYACASAGARLGRFLLTGRGAMLAAQIV